MEKEALKCDPFWGPSHSPIEAIFVLCSYQEAEITLLDLLKFYMTWTKESTRMRMTLS